MWMIDSYSAHGTSGWLYQDRILNSALVDGCTLVGVLDGHGESSSMVDFCAEQLPRRLKDIRLTSTKEQRADPERYIKKTFEAIAQDSRQQQGGACVALACLRDDGVLVNAVLGDSTFIAYLGDESKMLVYGPHHNAVTNLIERRKATERGARYDEKEQMLEYHGDYIAMGRAFANGMGGTVVQDPTVWQFALGKGGWIALHTDGVIDPASNLYREVARHARDMINAGTSAKEIVDKFKNKDDATLVIAKFS
jgi:serine/threonine protein phosphatase PrpC